LQHPQVLAEEIMNGERAGNNGRWDSMKVKIGKGRMKNAEEE
jgi:hypothetical protein